ncbi:MAG: redox-regulated ATPase YchF [Bacilli bacterium]
MSLRVGIIGMPNVGKSTLFNAITKKRILAANYPFATIDPNIGIVIVPDKRLEKLENMYLPEKLTPTSFEFIDIAGLVKGASTGEGLGNKFLSHIREVDAICEVVRCFDDENIIHVEGKVDPIRDIETINLELIFADLEVLEARIERIKKKAETTKDKNMIIEYNTVLKIKNALENNIASRLLDLDEDEKNIIRSYNLLTMKPLIYMSNIKEQNIIDDNEYVIKVKQYAEKERAQLVKICAKIEEELSELNEEDKDLFLKDLGIEESGLDLLIRKSYELLGLKTFFTAGDTEVKAWTYKKGMKAPKCAGIIHSDFERGFIKAEVISYDELIKYKNEKEAKDNGKMRIEGKDYIMQDGDVCHFRFNV